MQKEFQKSGDFQLMSYIISYPIKMNNATNRYITKWIRCVNEKSRNKIKYKEKGMKEFLVWKEKCENKNHNKSINSYIIEIEI